MSALEQQIGGNHYKCFPYQPVEFYHKTKLQGTLCLAVRYITRNKKNVKEDLQKAKHCIQLYKEICLKYPENIEVTDFTTMMNESLDFVKKNKLPNDIANVFNRICTLSIYGDKSLVTANSQSVIEGIEQLLTR